MKSLPFALSLSTLASSVANAADTQTPEIERLLVTSDFRATELQRLPASASVLLQELIEARQAQHLEETLGAAVNVNVASGASRGRFVQIRGIGERSQFSEPLNPSVGFHIDAFDFSGEAALGTLYDVAQVEVLRGPQATEFGAGALAGVIKVQTVDAGDAAPSRLDVSLAEQGTWSVGAAHGGALSDSLLFRVSAQQFKSDGFIDNIHLNRDDTDNIDELTGRMKLKYLASKRLTLDAQYQYFDIDNGYDAFSLDNDGQTRSDEPGFDRQQTHAWGLKAEYAYDWGNLLGVVSHADSDIAYGYDEDWTFVGFHPWEYQSTDHYLRERQRSSVDLRAVSSRAIFDNTTQWVAGVYASTSDTDLLREYTYNEVDFTSQYALDNRAMYVQTDTALGDGLSLKVGLRVDQFDLEYADNIGFSETNDDVMVGGRIVLDYALPRANVYASVSRGYKAAGFNPDQQVSNDNRTYSPEYNWNYEFGVKGRLADGRGVVRMAVFYMDREDTQINDFDVLLRDDGTAEFVDIIVNADTGKNWGAELETRWQLASDVELSVNLGYLDATFSGAQLANGDRVEKREQAQAPKYTANVALRWSISSDLAWRIEADAKDDYRFSDGHEVRSPSYVLANTQLEYQLADWALAVWVKNLFDREYYVRGFGGFSNDPRDFYATPEPYYQLGDGRQAGITARYTF